MIVRLAALAPLALALAATPAFAGQSVADTHVQASGPSGKTAHRSYRPIVPAAKPAGVIHTVPAGKISHWATAHNARVAADQAAAAKAQRLALAATPAQD